MSSESNTLQTTGVAYIPEMIIGLSPNPKGGGLCRMTVFVTFVSQWDYIFLVIIKLGVLTFIPIPKPKTAAWEHCRRSKYISITIVHEARTSNIRIKNNWGRQTTLRGATNTSAQVGSFLANWKPVIPINALTRFRNPVCLTGTTFPSCRKYILGDRRH